MQKNLENTLKILNDVFKEHKLPLKLFNDKVVLPLDNEDKLIEYNIYYEKDQDGLYITMLELINFILRNTIEEEINVVSTISGTVLHLEVNNEEQEEIVTFEKENLNVKNRIIRIRNN